MYFDILINYFIPEVCWYLCVYLSFMWVAISLPNRLINERKIGKAIVAILPVFILVWITLVFISFYKEPFKHGLAITAVFTEFKTAINIFGLLTAYQVGKRTVIWYRANHQSNLSRENRILFKDIFYFVFFWLLLLVPAVVFHVSDAVGFFFLLVVPGAFINHTVLVHWLLKSKVKSPLFWPQLIIVSLLVSAPLIGIFTYMGTRGSNNWPSVFMAFWLGQQMLIMPLALAVFSHRKNVESEISNLRSGLNTSSANLQFLRSQVNPHFLFNALNTLYGTALSENAEKTGEGIQKLGDMMRFMLHENMQDKIALSRELDYLTNYIDLQNLRISSSPDITIDVAIPAIEGYYQIAPMLLIPFVENAYKHGISLRERSWINISVSLSGNELQLDVYNSVHTHLANDPEREHSGIGLENVKQRLLHLYPQRHELVIRQTTKEFFIHFTIKL
ncbi:MAG: histidine kinase [Sphingobacteriaceae bacterium]|nr:MAG: histidine kinase [Sphingobacteriaceae bacterium]